MARFAQGMFWPRVIKRWLPSTLFGRSLLIIVLPVAVMQIVVTWIFFDAHWQTVTSRLSEGLAGDVAWVVDSYEADPSPAGLSKLTDRAVDADDGIRNPTPSSSTIIRGGIGVLNCDICSATDRAHSSRFTTTCGTP